MTVRVIASGRHLRLMERDGWEYAERARGSGVVAILAITTDQKLVLTEQYRSAFDTRVIDLPAGLAGDEGDAGEAFAIAAQRELEEEVGYQAKTMVELAAFPTSPGLSSEKVTLFKAEGLTKVSAGGGLPSEEIVVHEVALAELDRFLAGAAQKGMLIDPKIWSALYLAKR